MLVVGGPRSRSGERKKSGFAPVYFWNGGGLAVFFFAANTFFDETTFEKQKK